MDSPLHLMMSVGVMLRDVMYSDNFKNIVVKGVQNPIYNLFRNSDKITKTLIYIIIAVVCPSVCMCTYLRENGDPLPT